MEQVVIENPIINSPFEEPERHFRFTEDGITNEISDARRVSSYFIPVPKPKKKSKQQLTFATEWKQDRIKENEFINHIRARVAGWRQGGYPGITRTTSRLLEYWQRSEREPRLFFCQIEALETLIYITEAAKKYGDSWIENELRKANKDAIFFIVLLLRWPRAVARPWLWLCSLHGMSLTKMPVSRTSVFQIRFLS